MIVYKVKDYNRSWANHATRIKKLKHQGVQFRDIIDVYFEDTIISNIVQGPYFRYNGSRLNERSIKPLVNYTTRKLIQDSLAYNGIKRTYDTAFYLLFYSSVNKLMGRVSKILLNEYVGAM